MTPMRLRSALRRSRRSATALALVAFLACLVALHHGPTMPMDHQGDQGGMAANVALTAACLAVLGSAAAAAIALGGARRLPRAPVLHRSTARVVLSPPSPTAPARAGPAHLQVFRN